MKFFGQEKILKEVSLIEAEIRKGVHLNVLLTAPSGWGKTTLALQMINRTVGVDKASYGVPPTFYIIPEKPFNFIDEIHLLTEPEVLYPYLDSNSSTYVLATNELGLLKEPLVNRCIPLVFDPYTLDDITCIVMEVMKRFNLPWEVAKSIAEKSKLNPRVAKMLCQRLSYVFSNLGIPDTASKLDALADKILDLSQQGLNSMDRRYLDFLKLSGGRASLTLIQYSLNLSRDTILRDIEPGLIHLGLIKIGSKGRELAHGV
jgi:Holliday junction resolvasome RuvABC ATP-dependent DNA helicase subunit